MSRRQTPTERQEREIFVGQCWLLMNRAARGLPLDPRSLRSLARLAEQLAEREERRA